MNSMPSPERSPVWLRASLFLALYGALHLAYQALRDSRFDPWFIHSLTVRPAVALIGMIFPLDGVTAAGSRLVWPDGRLTLLAGCDGFEVISLFVAAMLVADMPWRRGVPALLGGVMLAWAMNQLRITWLYWAFRYQRQWFDDIHTVWGPLLLIAAVSALFWWALGAGSLRRPWPDKSAAHQSGAG